LSRRSFAAHSVLVSGSVLVGGSVLAGSISQARAAPPTGLDWFHPDNVFAAQTQRLVAEAMYGAADIFEIESACRELSPGDVSAWDAVWMQCAERAEVDAKAAIVDGRRTTAMNRDFHAAGYFRQSEMFFTGGDTRKAERFRRAQTAFRSAAALSPTQIRVVQIKSGTETYDGYWCLPASYRSGDRLPAVFFIGGADSYAEENYFSGLAMLARGTAMLLLDTPGRGSAIYLKGIPTRVDYEVPVAAALDWMEAQSEVDPARMGLVGISMGAYYAPRAAAFDKRVRALVCWSGTINLLRDLYLYNPSIQRQLQWITGSADDATAREKLAAYDLTGVAGRIMCPTMVVHGRNDLVMDPAGAESFFAALKAQDKTLRIFAGTGHCCYSTWTTVVPFIFDWLTTKLRT